MLACGSHRIEGFELLFRHRIDFSDKAKMLEVDIAAVKAARALCKFYNMNMRVHCNVELSSMLNIDWVVAMAENVCRGMVIEIVERNEALKHPRTLDQIQGICAGIRGLGGAVALDDVEGTDLEASLIEVLRPEVLKANSVSGLDFITSFGTKSIVVAEQIESPDLAHQAAKCGATELQGYWCDVLKEDEVHPALTPPGVTARNRQLMAAAA
ncbi:EAL domain protein [Acidovorax sp. LjRoot129]|uniref:EAL domain protein n=1 Tax=unclassified Acidovorax TaxID=2684926 RepID=UPI003ED02E76